MAKVLDMPKLSPTMEEGQLAIWHKKEGDSVEVDELLAEVETDKATMEFRSFDKGTLLKILVPAGSVVQLGQAVAILGNPGDDISGLVGQGTAAPAKEDKQPDQDAKPAPKEDKQPDQEAKPAAKEDEQPDQEAKPAAKEDKQPDEEAPAASKDEAADEASADAELPSSDERVKASPYVRKLAREQDLDLSGVQGSGPHGRIVAKDLANAPTVSAKTSKGPKAPSPTLELRAPEKRPLSMMRKTIARRLTESKQTVPHFYLTIDVDAGPLASLREQIVNDLGEEGKDRKVSVNDLLVKACALALRRVPECNAQFTPEAILVHDRVDISVAVAVPDGLLTPVVRDADTKTVAQIATDIRALATKAKNKKLTPEEMSNGTFSISNLGMFGIDNFSAVINPPEGAILAVGRVRDEPMVKDGQVVAGKRLAMTLSCDHRVVDGAVGARFLAALRSILERPTQILVG
jgi:pyruvate dehydrogenase E2 component (dihydrolipoamide acetyltransferase)